MANRTDESRQRMGITFTKTRHDEPKGPTIPENNQPKSEKFIVVITGAGKGLGYSTSLAYARAGVSGLCISSRTQSDLDKLSKELLVINPSLQILSKICDTSRSEDVEALADETKQRFGGRLDVVVANAGIISKYLPDGSLPTGIVEDDDFARVTNINYLGTYYTAKYFASLLMSADNESNIRAFVAITSLASQVAESSFVPVAYNISKIAMNRMVEHMANDHGKDGLLTFAVHPGEVLTPQTEKHSQQEGDRWATSLMTDPSLCGGFLTWLTAEARPWLSGRYLDCHWDVTELEQKKDDIVSGDKLKFRMVV